MTDLAELKALAEAATPGDWHHDGNCGNRISDPSGDYILRAYSEQDREFVIAANPSAIIALIERVESAEAVEPLNAAMPLDADKIDRMARWCHARQETTCISGAAGLDLLAALKNAEQRGYQRGMEEAAKWHEAEITRLEDQIEHNNEYARRSGNFNGEANDFCRSLISNHRSGAAAIRALGEKAG